MKRAHTIEQIKAMVAWCKKNKRSPAHWLSLLQEAINADLKATVKSRKARKAA